MARVARHSGGAEFADSESLRLPPHSIEAEQAVLGGLMLDNEAWEQLADRLDEQDFYRQDHRLIFRAICELAERGEPCDAVTLAEHLTRSNQLEQAGGLAYLGGLAKDTPSAANVGAYADIVRERSMLRQLIRVGTDVARSAYESDGRTGTELVDAAEAQIFEIADHSKRRGSGFVALKKILPDTIDRLDLLHQNEGQLTGVATGFTEFDKLTAGLQRGDLIIIAGRPSMGKTTLAINIAENAALGAKVPVAIFSMEMSAEQLSFRMISSLGRVNQANLRVGRFSDEDWSRINGAVQLMSEASIFVDDTPALTPTEVRARARRLKREHGLGLIVIDYLQLMQVIGTKENRATEISEISRSLKSLAKELGVPVIALSQLNRSVEQRSEKKPVMSDLRECVTGDTLVWLTDGRRVPIRSLVGLEPEVWSLDERQRVIPARSDKVWCVGRKPVFRVRLASGRSIRATAEHRLMAGRGWTTVADLAVGDRLAIARGVPEQAQPERWPAQMRGTANGGNSHFRCAPGSATLAEYTELLSASDVARRARPDLFWDRITAVVPEGEEQVFDLTVPGQGNWLADGIVTHNSGAIEQDADLIVFIYREEVYDPDTPRKGVAEINVAKQRNGPIGEFPLTFLGKYTKFENWVPEAYSDGVFQ